VDAAARTSGGRRRVLVVDDEPSIVDAVATTLRYNDFEVETASSGREGLAKAIEFEPDLMVLDRMLSDFDGTELQRKLRERGREPAVLYLTAKDAVDDKIEALKAGGDDYVTKPFSLAEVIARSEAILRRTGAQPQEPVLSFADVVLDDARHEVRRGEVVINLTATEYSLLRFFLLNPRQALSKEQILQNVWHYDFGGSAGVVETYVSYLRRKLDAAGPPLIKTVRQFGYMLDAPKR
jgi:two-component system OmpR family response regulator